MKETSNHSNQTVTQKFLKVINVSVRIKKFKILQFIIYLIEDPFLIVWCSLAVEVDWQLMCQLLYLRWVVGQLWQLWQLWQPWLVWPVPEKLGLEHYDVAHYLTSHGQTVLEKGRVISFT